MAFEYGSSDLDIKNPFRFEGVLTIGRGLITAFLGGLIIFAMRDGVDPATLAASDEARTLGWIKLSGGAFLLTAGLISLGAGLFKALRFYVGRGVPADLTQTLGPVSLAKMLRDRTNLMFFEPVGLLARVVHGLFPRLLFMPVPIRAASIHIAAAFFYTLLVLFILALAIFSGSAGLTPIDDWASGWLAALAAIAVLGIWARAYPGARWLRASSLPTVSVKKTVALIIAAILAPVLLMSLPADARTVAPPFSGGLWLTGLVLGGMAVTGAAFFLLSQRMQIARDRTEVSEFRQHWVESLHPMDIFRAFDMTMADHRYLEIPNREYFGNEAKLNMQGSTDKGDFRGQSLIEIQPVPVETQFPPLFRPGRAILTIVAQTAMLIAAIWFYIVVSGLQTAQVAGWGTALAAPLALWLFGGLGARVANLYWAEIFFSSHMLHFFAEGTYTESKVSTGMAITDSTRSENVLVRSSLTPWMFLSQVHSTTFAVSGAYNLEQNRYVVELTKNDAFLDKITSDLRRYLDSRQVIADIKSDGDLKSTSAIHGLNTAARGNAQASIPLREEDRNPRHALDVDVGGTPDADAKNRE